MNDPILSLRIWSHYVLALGLGLLAIPNQILDVFGVENTSEVWIRTAGLVAIVLGIVYFQGAREGNLGVVRSSVPGRIAAVAAFVVLAVTGGPWQLLLFAAVDLAGLLWTWSALRTPALSV